MIISYTYKYVFVQVPNTGSAAIADELRANYGGTSILRKHAYYPEFLAVANPEEREYRVLTGIRNPLDETVAEYHKFQNNHQGIYTDPRNMRDQGGWLVPSDQAKYRYIQDHDPDFGSFFLKFYTQPYTNVSSLSGSAPNFVIRFEHLQEDFARALDLMGIAQKRPLTCPPESEGSMHDYRAYYTPECYARAKRVFGPFMARWGYQFPRQWGQATLPWAYKLHFRMVEALKGFYWMHLKWGNTRYARAFRALWLRAS